MRPLLACAALLVAGASLLPAQAMRSYTTSRPARAGDPALLRTTLDFGAGRVVLRAGATDQLYRMQLRYDAERFAPIHAYEPAVGALHLGLEQQGRGGIRVTSRAQLEQVARFEFAPQAPAERSLQGYSEAQWFRQRQSRGVLGQRTPPGGGSLVVRTTQLTGGYLRPNGGPFSERATVKGFFNTFTLPGDAGAWLVVTMVVDDPEYLTTQLLISSQFKKEASRAAWSPRPCDIAPPLRAPAPTPADPFAAAVSRP